MAWVVEDVEAFCLKICEKKKRTRHEANRQVVVDVCLYKIVGVKCR